MSRNKTQMGVSFYAKNFAMEIFGIYLTVFQLFALMFSSLLLGMSKTGIQGISIISIPLMAMAFGAKESTGVVLPILCFADLIAVIYYKRDCVFKYVVRLLPSAVAGFFLAIAIDKMVPENMFKVLLAICILGGFVIMAFDKKLTSQNSCVNSWWYAPLFGILGGFSTMIGNAAGPVMAVYLLSMHLPKFAFVGTNAWFFLCVNYLKLPLQGFVWKNITLQTLAIDCLGIPAIFIGAILGIYLTKLLPEKAYHKFIIAVTIVSTLALLF